MRRDLIPLTFALAAAAGSAGAQIAPVSPAPGVDPHLYRADQHRYEVDRLRAQADQRESFARQLEAETRRRRIEIEAAGRTDVAREPSARAIRSPEEERALRESATRRRRATTVGVAGIDAWLDRPR